MSDHCKGVPLPSAGFNGFCAEIASWCTPDGMFTRHFIDVDWEALGRPPLRDAQPFAVAQKP